MCNSFCGCSTFVVKGIRWRRGPVASLGRAPVAVHSNTKYRGEFARVQTDLYASHSARLIALGCLIATFIAAGLSGSPEPAAATTATATSSDTTTTEPNNCSSATRSELPGAAAPPRPRPGSTAPPRPLFAPRRRQHRQQEGAKIARRKRPTKARHRAPLTPSSHSPISTSLSTTVLAASRSRAYPPACRPSHADWPVQHPWKRALAPLQYTAVHRCRLCNASHGPASRYIWAWYPAIRPRMVASGFRMGSRSNTGA